MGIPGHDSTPAHAVEPEIARSAALAAEGQFAEALKVISSAVASCPDHAELLLARALVHLDWGRMRDAHEGLVRVVAAGLSRPDIYLNLAWTQFSLGDPGEADRTIRRALAMDPRSEAIRFAQGVILHGLARHEEAIAAFEVLLAGNPERVDCLTHIAACCLDQRQFEQAEAATRQAIAVDPGQAGAWLNLALALTEMDRHDEARQALQRADDIERTTGMSAESLARHVYCRMRFGEPHGVVELCRRYLPLHPSPDAHAQYALALLSTGQFREGWDQYEYRWFQDLRSERIATHHPPWSGQPLHRKVLLIRAEQGAGDTFQFARYASWFKAKGATVILQVRPELRRLFEKFAGADQVLSLKDVPTRFDYYLNLMSAPRALMDVAPTIPDGIPYLHAGDAIARAWSARLPAQRPLVGLAWAGNPKHLQDRHRSLPLAALDSLLQTDDAQFVSLQQALTPDEVKRLAKASVPSLGTEFHDFHDTAGAIANLDLVICVDTAVAHLAGAMCKPVWLLLPYVGEFRWLMKRDDSPWYPTMRIFRQSRLGDWSDVVLRVKAALTDAIVSGNVNEALVIRAAPAPFAPVDSAHSPAPSSNAPAAMDGRGPIARVTETRDGIMQFLPDINDAGRSLAWYGEFLRAQLDLLTTLVRPGAVVLEVGSGIGSHALALARMVGPEGHLFVCENRPIMKVVLEQNLAANELLTRNTVMRSPLRGAPDPARPLSLTADHVAAKVKATHSGNADTVDQLLLDRLDLLKVMEGDAAMVLAGAHESLWRLRPVLFLAAADEATVVSLAGDTAGFGYRCWQVRSSYFSAHNFNVREQDIFDGRVAWALLAIPEERPAVIGGEGRTELDLSKGRSVEATGNAEASHAVDRRENAGSSSGGVMGLLRRLLRRGDDPRVDAVLREAAMLRNQGRDGDAAALLSRSLEKLPASAALQVEFGNVRRALGLAEDALQAYDRALAIAPDAIDALIGRASALVLAGRNSEGLAAYQRSVAVDPSRLDALCGLAGAYCAVGRVGEAHEMLDRAIDLQPEHVDARRERASLLAMSGQHADALVDLDVMARLRPEDPVVHFTRGTALWAIGESEKSVDAFESALVLQPDFQQALHNMGVVLVELGDFDRASVAFEQLVALNPGFPHALGNMLNTRAQLANWQDYVEVAASIVAGVEQGAPVCLPLIALSITDSATVQQRCSQVLVNERHPPIAPNSWSGSTYHHDRIRLAYVSGDFHEHAVAYLTAGLYEAHDRARFEVNAISIGADSTSAMRQRVRTGVDHFIEARHLSDEAIVTLMREREIDIAIDLSGFTGTSRPGVFARRAAPVQVNYLGFPGTMGAPYIDYIVADGFVIPPEMAVHYTEKAVWLPGAFQANDSKRHIPRPTLTRTDAGLPPTGFVFCAFNNTYKISPDVYSIWLRLLGAVEGSTLWLLGSGSTAMSNLRREAAARGVDPQRIVFTSKRPYHDYLDQYLLADLFLDTFPFNAGTTASDALWAGVPVVTRSGQSFASRMAGSLLRAVGLPELVTHSVADYEALALSLAQDATRLHDLHTRLALARKESDLFDSTVFCSGLESAYEEMVALSRSGSAPRALKVKVKTYR